MWCLPTFMRIVISWLCTTHRDRLSSSPTFEILYFPFSFTPSDSRLWCRVVLRVGKHVGRLSLSLPPSRPPSVRPSLPLSLGKPLYGRIDISLQCFCFSVLYSPSVHRLTSSIHAVLHLPGKHFPSISPSVTAVTSPSLLPFQCPDLANFRFFSCSSSHFARLQDHN